MSELPRDKQQEEDRKAGEEGGRTTQKPNKAAANNTADTAQTAFKKKFLGVGYVLKIQIPKYLYVKTLISLL